MLADGTADAGRVFGHRVKQFRLAFKSGDDFGKLPGETAGRFVDGIFVLFHNRGNLRRTFVHIADQAAQMIALRGNGAFQAGNFLRRGIRRFVQTANFRFQTVIDFTRLLGGFAGSFKRSGKIFFQPVDGFARLAGNATGRGRKLFDLTVEFGFDFFDFGQRSIDAAELFGQRTFGQTALGNRHVAGFVQPFGLRGDRVVDFV